MASLIAAMHCDNFAVLWYEDAVATTARLLRLEFAWRLPALAEAWHERTDPVPRMTRTLLKSLLLLKHPAHWSYFIHAQDATATQRRPAEAG